MGVTSYYSFGGEIIGEETGGVRRDYLTDALGSVTATVTDAGVVENTYRYKPYGETLAKTGTGSDPKFLWNGKWGYKVSENDIKYIRNRCYQSIYNIWLSKDLIISKEYNLYQYCDSDPINKIDYDGYMPINRPSIDCNKDKKEIGIIQAYCNIDQYFFNNMIDPSTNTTIPSELEKPLIGHPSYDFPQVTAGCSPCSDKNDPNKQGQPGITFRPPFYKLPTIYQSCIWMHEYRRARCCYLTGDVALIEPREHWKILACVRDALIKCKISIPQCNPKGGLPGGNGANDCKALGFRPSFLPK